MLGQEQQPGAIEIGGLHGSTREDVGFGEEGTPSTALEHHHTVVESESTETKSVVAAVS